ncbi:MAG: rhodanese-like domain-containing protein, partial [Planctomycetota bacterium]
ETDEYAMCKIEGARLLPMSELAQRVEELDDQKNSHIVVHCHHGGRSLRVTQYLREAGFAKVQNMTGGIDAWSLEIDSEVPRY